MYRHEGKNIDWTNHYAVIGNYVVEFENVVWKIRFNLSGILQINGLKNFKLSEIIFGNKMYTAEPLIGCFESICNELLKNIDGSSELLDAIKSFKKRFTKQIQIRNDLLHATYMFGPNVITITEDPNPPSDLLAVKESHTKEGARKKRVSEKLEDIKVHVDELVELNIEFNTIIGKLHVFFHENAKKTPK